MSRSLSEEGIESFGLKYVLVGGHRGIGGPVQRQGCQLLLGQESHCGGASDTSERPELYWGGGTVCAVLVHSPYRSVSRADGWGQSGLGQGHIHGCPQVSPFMRSVALPLHTWFCICVYCSAQGTLCPWA